MTSKSASPSSMTSDQLFESRVLYDMCSKLELLEMYMRVKTELESIQLGLLNAEAEYDRALRMRGVGPLRDV